MTATVWFVDERGDMRRVSTGSRALVASLEARYGDVAVLEYVDNETGGTIALL